MRVPRPRWFGPWAGPWGWWRCGPKPRRESGCCWWWEGEKDWSHPWNRRWRATTSCLQSKIREGSRPFENRRWWWSNTWWSTPLWESWTVERSIWPKRLTYLANSKQFALHDLASRADLLSGSNRRRLRETERGFGSDCLGFLVFFFFNDIRRKVEKCTFHSHVTINYLIQYSRYVL